MIAREARDVLDLIFRRERSPSLACLIRFTGDFSWAEDALQEAFTDALKQWPADGVPPRPGAWITTVARRRAIDVVRRARTFRRRQEVLERLQAAEPTSFEAPVAVPNEDDGVPRDDRLRLLYMLSPGTIQIGRAHVELQSPCNLVCRL